MFARPILAKSNLTKHSLSINIIKKAVVLLITMVVAFFAGIAGAEDTIKIAVVGPITGPVAQYGKMQMDGASVAVEQINAKGGVLGKKLEAVLLDDVCEPRQAVAIANRVVSQGIKFVVGHLCSSATQPATDIYDEDQILMITPAATNPAITEGKYPLIFRTIGLDQKQGAIAGEYIVNQVKPKNMAILHDKQQYGEGVATEVKKYVEAKGITPVMFDGLSKGQTNFSALITKMQSKKVDFVYYGGYHPELGILLRQARERGFDAGFMGPEGVGNKDISAIAGEASEGLLVTLPADFSKDPANKELIEVFKAKKIDPTGPFVMPSYAAVQIIAETIAKTKSTDPVKIAEVMHATEYATPIGTVKYDEKGDLQDFKFVVFTWHADGSKTEAKAAAE